jgi:tripartite-type tricarboxylate transporter receptor subunit TctC
LFKVLAGVDLVHVPYRGSTPALTDMLGGQVQVMFDVTPSSLPHIRSGKLRALAITTTTRSDVLPELAPMADFVPGYEASAWIGFGVPANTPRPVIEILNREINAAISDPKIKGRLADLGGMVLPPATPAEFSKMIADDIEKWTKVVKASGIKPG